MAEMKYCAKCNQTKPESDFSRNATRYDGLQTHCKECSKSRLFDWRRSNNRKVAATRKKRDDKQRRDFDNGKIVIRDYKTCAKCHEEKGSAWFYVIRHMPGALDAYCIDCRKAYARERSSRR